MEDGTYSIGVYFIGWHFIELLDFSLYLTIRPLLPSYLAIEERYYTPSRSLHWGRLDARISLDGPRIRLLRLVLLQPFSLGRHGGHPSVSVPQLLNVDSICHEVPVCQSDKLALKELQHVWRQPRDQRPVKPKKVCQSSHSPQGRPNN